MPVSKLGALAGGLIFLALAGLALYRLMVWFPITIGGHAIGQTATLFTFAICAALSLIMFQGLRGARH
jgi:hypothetical protein